MADWGFDTWIALLSLTVFLGLTYSSAWLRGSSWYLATVFSMGVFLVAMSANALRAESGLRLWAGALGMLMLFGLFFYWVSARHITQTRMLDLTYHSHDAVVRYITERQLSSPLARLLRVLGPVLLATVIVLTAFAVAIQFRLLR
jgi:hypothetical protein